MRWSALLLMLAVARPVCAAKTDIVVLINDDRLTCEVKALSRGQLQVKTDHLGTVYIEWDKVTSVVTAGTFDVATHDGRRLVGRLGPAAAGQVSIIDAMGTTTALPFLDVVSLVPINSKFFQRMDGSIDLGASYTKSSGVAQASLDADASYTRPSFTASTQLSMSLTRQPEAPDTGRYSWQFGYTRFRPGRWQVSPFAYIEHNPDLGFDLRSTVAVAVGRNMVQSNRATVLVSGGVAIGREQPVSGDTVTNVDALLGATMSLFTYDYPKTNIDFSVLVFPGLNNVGRVRINANGKLKRELFHDFFLALTGYDSYDNRPQTAGADKNDVGLTLSIGWTF